MLEPIEKLYVDVDNENLRRRHREGSPAAKPRCTDMEHRSGGGKSRLVVPTRAASSAITANS